VGHIIVGTAGHIDHGKSLLVKALTGTDPDRLPEEQQRHITIDIGFAFLDDVAAIIDVPGHERFIRNMVAGAATVDYAMLIVAADDGAMPQTQEHLDILQLLGIEHGVVVITKADLVESDWLELVRDQIKGLTASTFLQDASVFAVDSLSGRGVAELRAFLLAELAGLRRKGDRGFFRLPIDRVFQMKGYGTIVTGTIVSGMVMVEDRLELLPRRKEVRVRGLQTHGAPQTSLEMGQRTAINLGGVDKDLLRRGDVLATPGHLVSCNHWRGTVSLLRDVSPLKNRQRLRIHIGTQEVIARVVPLQSDPPLVDFYLESPAVASRLDRFVLRTYSPMTTIGGGVVIEVDVPPTARRRRADELKTSAALARAKEAEFINVYLEGRMPFGASMLDLIRASGYGKEKIADWTEDLLAQGRIVALGEKYLSFSSLEQHHNGILKVLSEFHREKPELPGIERAELRQAALPAISESLFAAILKTLSDAGKIRVHGSVVSLPDHTALLSASHEKLAESLLNTVRDTVFRPPPVADMAKMLNMPPNEVLHVLVLLVKQGRLVRLEPELFFDPDVFQDAVSKLRDEIKSRGAVTVGNVTALLDSTRKYVVPFLEYTDKMGVTRRDGDQRVAGSKETP
jgi:selenocysteine-specific elongation factor